MNTVISQDGTKIAFDKTGNGPALIIVDGALCYRSFGPAKAIAELLQSDFTVYYYDRRGRGDSGDTAPYTIEKEVEDIAALIKEAGGSAFLFGQSSGAALSLEAANRLKGVNKLAVYEAPFIVDATAPPLPADLLKKTNALVQADRRSDTVKLFMKTVGTPFFAIFMMQLMPMWSKLKAVAHTIPYDFTLLNEFGSGKPLPKNRWGNIQVPTLVMDGAKSPVSMRNAMKSLAENLPLATYHTLDKQNHMVKAEALAPVLANFFEEGSH